MVTGRLHGLVAGCPSQAVANVAAPLRKNLEGSFFSTCHFTVEINLIYFIFSFGPEMQGHQEQGTKPKSF